MSRPRNTTLLVLVLALCVAFAFAGKSKLKTWPDEDGAPFGPFSDDFGGNVDPKPEDPNKNPNDIPKPVDTKDPVVPTKPTIDHSTPEQKLCDTHPIINSSSPFFHGNTQLVHTPITPENNVCPMSAGKASCCHEWTLYQLDVSLTAAKDSLMKVATTVTNFPTRLRDQVNMWESETIKIGFVDTGKSLCDLVDDLGYRVCDMVYNLATETNSFAKRLGETLTECINTMDMYYHGMACLMCDPNPKNVKEVTVNKIGIYTVGVNENMAKVVASKCMPYFNIQVEWMKSVSDAIFGKNGLDSNLFGLRKKLEKKVVAYASKSMKTVVSLAKDALAGVYVDRVFEKEFFGGIDAVLETWDNIVSWTEKLGANSVDDQSVEEEMVFGDIETSEDLMVSTSAKKEKSALEKAKENNPVFSPKGVKNVWDAKDNTFDPLKLIMEPTKAELIENLEEMNAKDRKSFPLTTVILCVIGAVCIGLLVWKRDTVLDLLPWRKHRWDEYVNF